MKHPGLLPCSTFCVYVIFQSDDLSRYGKYMLKCWVVTWNLRVTDFKLPCHVSFRKNIHAGDGNFNRHTHADLGKEMQPPFNWVIVPRDVDSCSNPVWGCHNNILHKSHTSLRTDEIREASFTYSSMAVINDAGGCINSKKLTQNSEGLLMDNQSAW